MSPWIALLLLLPPVACTAWHLAKRVRLVRSFRNDFAFPQTDGFYHKDNGPPPYQGGTRWRLDDAGVVLHDYGPPLGPRINPVTVAQFALGFVPYAEEEEARALLARNLDALLQGAQETPAGNLVFPVDFDWPSAGETAPWTSGAYQGQAASAFLWGQRLLGDPRYLDAARRAVLALDEPELRLVRPLRVGVWLKEYPSYPFAVLDGSLAGIAGIYDLLRSLPEGDPDAGAVARLLERCLSGFKSCAHLFAAPFGGHSYDDVGILPLNAQYHAHDLAWLDYLAGHDRSLATIRARYEARGCLGRNVLQAAWSLWRTVLYVAGLVRPRLS